MSSNGVAPQKFQRKDLQQGENLCEHCTGKCCRYYALAIDTPTELKDFDHLRWYMIHGRTAIFVDGETWYLMVFGDCQHLQSDNRCGIYETRPQICRSYTTDNCEYDDDGVYDMYFETPEQIWEYAQARFPPSIRRRFSTEPVAAEQITLPVL